MRASARPIKDTGSFFLMLTRWLPDGTPHSGQKEGESQRPKFMCLLLSVPMTTERIALNPSWLDLCHRPPAPRNAGTWPLGTHQVLLERKRQERETGWQPAVPGPPCVLYCFPHDLIL